MGKLRIQYSNIHGFCLLYTVSRRVNIRLVNYQGTQQTTRVVGGGIVNNETAEVSRPKDVEYPGNTVTRDNALSPQFNYRTVSA